MWEVTSHPSLRLPHFHLHNFMLPQLPKHNVGLVNKTSGQQEKTDREGGQRVRDVKRIDGKADNRNRSERR